MYISTHTHTLRAQICAGSAVPWEHLASDFATLQAPSPATNGKANYVGQTRNQATAMFRPDPEEVVSFPPTTGPGEPLPASGHHANSQLSSSFPRSSISRLSSSLAGSATGKGGQCACSALLRLLGRCGLRFRGSASRYLACDTIPDGFRSINSVSLLCAWLVLCMHHTLGEVGSKPFLTCISTTASTWVYARHRNKVIAPIDQPVFAMISNKERFKMSWHCHAFPGPCCFRASKESHDALPLAVFQSLEQVGQDRVDKEMSFFASQESDSLHKLNQFLKTSNTLCRTSLNPGSRWSLRYAQNFDFKLEAETAANHLRPDVTN